MKESLLQRLMMTLALLFGAMSAASAADRFYMDPVNIEPGEIRTLAFNLENKNPYYGFQGDLKLPEGLEVVTENGKPSITLSQRADNSFQIVSNTMADGILRFGTFSTSHSSFTGNSGALLYIKVKATSEFTGGELTVKNILFIGSGDKDVEFPNISTSLGTEHNDTAFIPDFKIAVGEAKQISLELSNETSFTAFQLDLVLPEGLTIQDGSIRLSQRVSDHTVSAKSFSDGRTRIACLSLTNTPFSGNSGTLVSFTVIADKNIAEKSEMQLKNVIFTMPNAREYTLPNSVTQITSERALVESIALSPTEITMIADGSTTLIQATVLPTFASTKDLEWSSSAPEIASVSQAGVVTAKTPGIAVITASAVDGSGVTATCNVTVNGVPVTSVALNRTTASLKVGENVALTASVLPANASDKSIVWSSSDEAIATVDETGNVTAIAIGSATIKASSVSNPEFSGECRITVVPTPVAGITLSQSSVSIKVGGSVKIGATVSPESATNKAIVWSVANPEIASVDENGVVIGLSLGTTNLTVTAADDGGASATCVVNVIPTPAESISIETPERTSFKAGETIQLNATILPENATDKTTTWVSSNPGIISIDSKGLATAVSVGEATITATNSAGQTATITLTVIPTLAESLSVFPQSLTLKVGESGNIAVTFTPNTTTNKAMSYRSANEAVATVDDNGVVTGVGLGETEVVVTTQDGSSLSAIVKISVVPTPAETVSIEYNGPKSLRVGQTAQLSASVHPESATDKSVIWTVQNPGVLSVSSDGLLTAVGLGESWVSATTSNGKSAYLTFNVIPTSVSSISLNHNEVSLKATETVKLTATVMPDDATNKTIIWASSNNAVASVDAYGNVTAHSVGDAIVSATSTDGSNIVAECRVTVVATPVESITIEAGGSTTLKALQTVQLSAIITPETATDKSVSWSSSNSGIASVDENGLVTAQNVGTAIISAKSGAKLATISITVIPTIADAITLNRTTAALKVSGTIQLTASFLPETTTDKAVTWASSNEAIATVNSEGLVTAHALGECEITATTADGSNKSASCHITVGETAAESISIEPKGPFTFKAGETVRLSAKVLPETTTDKSVSWDAQSDVVSVDNSGLVTALRVGSCWVRATNSAGQEALVYFTVIPTPVTSIMLNSTSVQLKATETLKLEAVIAPADATDKSLTWRSSNTSVATVDANGNITAIAIGEAAITATANDGSGVSGTCSVTVVSTPVESVSMTASGSTTLKAGQTLQLSAKVLPETATDKTVVWTSSNAAIITVDNNGLVTAISVGTASITATAGDKLATMEITVEKTLADAITLNHATAVLKASGTIQLTVSFTPETTTDKTVTWISSNEAIATVNSEGLVTAHELGECVITAIAADGSNKSASCHITVEATRAQSISIEPKGPFTLKVGETIQFSAKVLPEETTDKTVAWQSQTMGVSIDANGLATALMPVENNWICATNSAGQTDYVYITVIPAEVVWTQQFECKPTDRVELTAGSENESEVSYRSVKPDGGFQQAEIENVGGKWYATFPEEGAYVLEAYLVDYPNITTRKTFNVVNPDDLLYIDGIYYRYTDSNRNALKVVRGYNMYSGDYTIPASVIGLDVLSIDNNAFYSCTELGKIVISDGIKEIGRESFGNGSISSIDIPASVVSIHSYAFNALDEINGHYSLMSISLRGFTPVAVNSTIFNGFINYDLCELHVPKGTSSLYASAEVWKEFKNIIDDLPGWVDVQSVEIVQGEEVSVVLGQTLQLTAKVLPENASDKSIEWTSEDNNIVTVTDRGLIQGNQVGKTRIFAKSTNGIQDIITVNVSPVEAENIEIILPKTELNVNESLKAEARILPENTTDKTVEWSVSDRSVLSVDGTGTIAALSPGQSYLYAKTVNGLSASALITVKPVLVESIIIPAQLKLEYGEEYEFTPEIMPDNASNKNLVWQSSNPAVGEVVNNKFVAKSVGETTVTCSSTDGSDVSASCVVTVVKSPTSVTLSEHEITLAEGKTYGLTAAIEPADATDTKLEWLSSDEKVAAISDCGIITPISEGFAYITVRLVNYPELSDECFVTVKKDDSGIETITLDNLKISVRNQQVVISEPGYGLRASLFSVNGMLINSAVSNGQDVVFDLAPETPYILNIGSYSLKIYSR